MLGIKELLKKMFLSRKFLLPVLFAILVGLNKKFAIGFSDADLTKIASVIVAFIVVEGAKDIVKKG